MDGFEWLGVRRIVFGSGTSAQLGRQAAALGTRCLVVTNIGQAGSHATLDALLEQLANAGVRCTTFRQQGEPTLDSLAQTLAAARAATVDLLVGLGGGSALDAAKATAGLLSNGGQPLDYMEVVGRGQPLQRPATPWIAVPTTAGTGAEVTRNAVIGCPERRCKASLRSEHLLATTVIVDPQLAIGAPPAVTASSGMDALCQLIESYTSPRANPVSDALAAEGIARVAECLPRAFADGQDLDAREGMALAALLSGMTLTNVGLGAVHGFAAPLGANYPIPHGTVCAALLPDVVEANIRALRARAAQHPALARYARLGRWLTHEPSATDAAAAEAGVGRLRELIGSLRIPTLREFGMRREDFPALVQLARQASSMRTNPIELSDEELLGVLEASW